MAAMMKPTASRAFGKALAARPARAQVVAQAANRFLWLPGSKPPAHLDGSLPGDYGFDPLNLGSEPEALRWYTQSELIHGRWAMAAVAGILIPGLFTKIGLLSVPAWYDAGKVAQDNSPIPFGPLLMIELFLMGWVETKRWMDFRKPQSQGEAGTFLGFEGMFKGTGENGYPGGIFDPLNFASGSEASKKELKIKEVKNGRLAMVAMLGFIAQYAATGKDPLTNLGEHLADPWNNNFCTNGVSVPFQL